MSSVTHVHSLETSYRGPPHPFKNAEVDAHSLTGIRNETVERLFVVKRVFRCPTGGNLEYSNQASVAMQWVLLCLSTGHDRRY
jgi:hypothetical protein